jgi:hypothetical protein
MKRIYILASKVQELYVSRRNNVVATYGTCSNNGLLLVSCFVSLIFRNIKRHVRVAKKVMPVNTANLFT